MVGFMVPRAQSWIWGCNRMGISQEVGQVHPHLLPGLGAPGRHAIMATVGIQAPLYSPLPSHLSVNVTLPLSPSPSGKARGLENTPFRGVYVC